MYLSEMSTYPDIEEHNGSSHGYLYIEQNQNPSGGFYNDSCSSSMDCYTDFNLVCKGGLCLCIQGFVPDQLGTCHISTDDLMVIWAIRFAVTAAVLLFCVLVLYCVFNKGACCCCRGDRDSRRNLLGDAEHANETCWHEAPPPYLEVVCPPPTYTEAIAKMAVPPVYGDEARENPTANPQFERSNSIGNVDMTSEDTTKRDSVSATSKRTGDVSSPSDADVGNDVALHL